MAGLPGVKMKIRALTEKDHADLAFALQQGVNYIAVSFVRRAEDVQEAKQAIAQAGRDTPVIAKLEKPEAIENLDAILHVNGYGYIEKGNFIFVYTLEELLKIEEASRQRVWKVIKLNYLNSTDAAEFVKPLLSEGGQIKTNGKAPNFQITDNAPGGAEDFAHESTMMVFDYEENMSQIEKVVQELDTRPQQVLVEATILQTTLLEFAETDNVVLMGRGGQWLLRGIPHVLRVRLIAPFEHRVKLWIKRTILEMGGKDAVVVDETADLEAAAEGIVTSAFGFQGQKCSAGSRAILVTDVYDAVLERVVERARRITTGPTERQENTMGPVIDYAAWRKILDYIETGHQEGRLVLGGHALATPEQGYFIEPTIFADVDRDARIAQEEIFGPVLAVIRARNFDDALEIANGTEYGLTGALYSRDRLRLERARHEFHVGNLYFNRKCTGALVGVEPFGGFNMSGTDSKAGGHDYLLLFMQAKSISEQL